jgi:hypothetical protein
VVLTPISRLYLAYISPISRLYLPYAAVVTPQHWKSAPSLSTPHAPPAGTVKFHFDMWGNGIAGAMSMEEMGATGRVHVSDATVARLRAEHFVVEEAHHLSVAQASELTLTLTLTLNLAVALTSP